MGIIVENPESASRIPFRRSPGLFYGWINIGLFFVIALITWGPQYSFGVFFKPLAEEFNWSRAETSLAMTLNLIVGGVLGSLGGSLSDRYGPRRVMWASAICIGVGYLVLSRLSGLGQLYLWYGLSVGAGMSVAYIIPAATVSRWFIRKRGFGVGLSLMGLSFSQILVPPVIALMIGAAGWRNTFALIGVATLGMVLVLASFLRKAPEDYGLWPDGSKEAPVTNQQGIAEGFTLKEAIRLPAFWLAFVLWICLSVPVFLTLVHVVPLATDVGVGPVEAAIVFSFIGAAGIGGRFIFGLICDRWGCKASAVLGMGLVGLAMVAMIFSRAAMGFYVAGTIFGLGYTGADTALVKLSGDFFGRRYIGAIIGLLGLGFRIGASLGAVLGGIIFDLSKKYQASFIAGGLCTAAGIVLIFVIFRYKPVAGPVAGSKEKVLGQA